MSKPASYTYITNEEWNTRIAELDRIASSCELCPRRCGVDRLKDETGFCGAPGKMVVSSVFPHHGEEPPLSGTGGSGTAFFTYCTLKCIFCQNFQLSHLAEGSAYSPSELAEKMLSLQTLGCHNINLVTATHFLPWVVRALKEAASQGLTVPVVYNCGGYELASVMALLSGIVDIYLPDMKYGDDAAANRYSSAPDYVAVNRAAVREMFRQVGPLRTDKDGIAFRGLCIRHLVLPEKMAGTEDVFNYLKSTFDPHDIFISLMAQYRPLHRAGDFPDINRIVAPEEYEPLKHKFVNEGFGGFYQEISKIDRSFVIDFKKRKNERLI
jgi:putative pyruvate formate lyase activating enzyme